MIGMASYNEPHTVKTCPDTGGKGAALPVEALTLPRAVRCTGKNCQHGPGEHHKPSPKRGVAPDRDDHKEFHQDPEDIRKVLKKEKRARGKLYVFLTVGTLAQIMFLLILGGLFVSFTLSQRLLGGKDTPSWPEINLVKPLPVGPVQTADGQLQMPLDKYYFNVGLRSDYRLQECQGPQLKRSFPDMDYALLGYNLLKGYPLAIGHDPGFTLPIFSADYRYDTDNRATHWIHLLYLQTSYELTNSLSASAHASAGFWGISFSASAGYKESSSQVATGEYVYIISRASCNYYYMKLLKRSAPPFHPVFLEWIFELNTTRHDDRYLEFIENYGTHYPVEMKFGASFTYEHRMTSADYKSERERKVDVAVSASYSGLFSVGGGFSMNSEQKEKASVFLKKVTTRTITIGAPPPADGDAMAWASTVKESPVPVTYDLESIEDLFTETFMKRYNFDYDRIKEKLGSLKQKYCEHLKEQGQVDNCAKLSPGLMMEGTRLHNHFASRKLSHKGQCIDECFKTSECVAMTFSEEREDSICYLYSETTPFTGTQEKDWSSMFILAEIDKQLALANTGIISISTRKSTNNDTSILEACEVACLSDPYCAAFTFCQCPDQREKCKLYTEKSMSLKREDGMTTYFISPRRQREFIRRTTTPATTSTNPTTAAPPADKSRTASSTVATD